MSSSPFEGDMRVAALIPMKPLHLAKSRLTGRLDSGQRAALAVGMFARVLTAAMESAVSEVWVIGSDDRLRDHAEQPGARWIEDRGTGLNGALSEAIRAADVVGMSSLYLPADLPFLRSSDIDALMADSEGGSKLVLAPAKRDGGTNAIFVPADSSFRPLLGYDSFRRHNESAKKLGMQFAVCDSPGFALDLDTTSDLARCEEVEPGLIERLVDPRNLPAGHAAESRLGLSGDA